VLTTFFYFAFRISLFYHILWGGSCGTGCILKIKNIWANS
jgi:hypothetical protein